MAESTKKTYYVSAKSKWLALLLSALGLIGFAGFHRLYVGKIWSGCLYFCTLGLLGIGTIYDIIKICVDDFEDADGFPLYADSSMKSNYKRRNLQSPTSITKIIISIFASFVLFSIMVSFVMVKIYYPHIIAQENPNNENGAKKSKSFHDRIIECEHQVIKEEMDVFLEDAKKAHMSEQNVKELCATLKALNIDFVRMDKLDLDTMKRKEWMRLPGGPTVHSTMQVNNCHEIAFQIPNIENLEFTQNRYLIIHVDKEEKRIRSISVRECFDPIDHWYYDSFAYYLCDRGKTGEQKGVLKEYGDFSTIFLSKEAINSINETINSDVQKEKGKGISSKFVYHIPYTRSDDKKLDVPFVTVDVECTMPSKTYGVSEEKMYKTFSFYTDGKIKDNPSWSNIKKNK